MDVFALDLSKSGTGWARFVTGEPRPTYGTWKLGSEWTDDGQLFVNIYKHLTDAWTFSQPDLVIYEAPLRGDYQSSEKNNFVANGLAAMVVFLCKAKRIRCEGCSNSTWRKIYLGRGKGLTSAEFKQAALKMARDFGMKPQNNNEADALGLLDYALNREQILPPWRQELTLTEQLRSRR
jgi:hypothetical protein